MLALMPASGRLSPFDRPFQAAVFVLPVLSVLIGALVFLGPGALGSTTAARVRGLPATGARVVALRVEVLRLLHDVAEPVAASDLTVEASAAGQSLTTWRGAAGSDGVAEVVLQGSAPIRDRLAIKITAPGRRGPRLLAGGEITLRRAPPAFVQLGALAGTSSGALDLRVDAARGVMASPFAETVRITVSRAGAAPGRRVDLELTGVGLDVTPTRVTTDERGVATVRVTPLAHNVELTVVARAGDEHARWEGRMPVIPGAIWIDPASRAGAITLLSPSPRPHAYLSLWSEEGRVAGAAVPLSRDDRGFFRGEATITAPPGARLVYATVAGDPREQGSGTVAWPIAPNEGAVATTRALDLLLDGQAEAQAREQKRAWAARRTGLILLGVAALCEVLLLLWQSRASQRRLEEHLAGASAAADGEEALPADDRDRLLRAARERPVLRALVLVSLVGLGFAMIAALSTFR